MTRRAPPRICPVEGPIRWHLHLALFLIIEICRQKALESPQAALLSFAEKSEQEGEPVSWSFSGHTWKIQNQVSYSGHANSFAACFVHINARATRNFLRYDRKCM